MRLRYELWSEFRKIGLEFNEVINADSEWLGDQGRISQRNFFINRRRKGAQLLKDCKLWSKRYPALSYCESVEFAILKRQGEDIAVRDKLRERWQRQTTDGGRTQLHSNFNL